MHALGLAPPKDLATTAAFIETATPIAIHQKHMGLKNGIDPNMECCERPVPAKYCTPLRQFTEPLLQLIACVAPDFEGYVESPELLLQDSRAFSNDEMNPTQPPAGSHLGLRRAS